MWLKNFFDYYYEGPPGDGMYGPRHWIWITISILLSFIFYRFFKGKPKPARIFMITVCILLFLIRLIKQFYRAFAGIENPVWLAIPWQLCTVMTFLMPIIVIFNIKKLKPMVYSLCMIGGIITLFLGNYFGNEFLKWDDYEGMWAHMLLIYIPVIEMAIGNFKLELKNVWQTLLGLLLSTIWALLADLVFFAKYDTNNSELMHNNLGFELPGIPFQFLYVIVGVVFIAGLYGIPTFYRKIRRKV